MHQVYQDQEDDDRDETRWVAISGALVVVGCLSILTAEWWFHRLIDALPTF